MKIQGEILTQNKKKYACSLSQAVFNKTNELLDFSVRLENNTF